MDASPEWPSLLEAVQGKSDEDELAAVPVLRFPHWIDEPLRVVSQLLALGFDMVVRFEVLHYVAGKRLGAV
jgi:hypothetical protein